ncbi:MAG: hypothetical protein QW478_11940 [Candidatus Micrarchaeaceae archaeon]
MISEDLFDRIDNEQLVNVLLRHVIFLGVNVRIVFFDRGYLDASVMDRLE